MATPETLHQSVKKIDPDRALCAYFLPEPARSDIFVLLAFHNEITRALAPARSTAVAGPMAAYIKLQWWRDVLDGTRPPEHALAPALLQAMARGSFRLETVLEILEAREAELTPQPDQACWQAMMLNGSGGLVCAVGEALGMRQPDTLQNLRFCGAAYGAAAMLRHGPALAQSGRYLYPGPPEDLRHIAIQFLQKAHSSIIPPLYGVAFLPAILAKRDLQRGAEQAGRPRGIADKMAVVMAGLKAQRRAKRL